jgi:hypothetical protein
MGAKLPFFNQARICDFRYRTSQMDYLATVMEFHASNICVTNLEHYCELRYI